eukprot:3507534-Rhodomonas_salina.3
MPGTEIAYARQTLSAYAQPGADTAHAATRCPILAYASVLRIWYRRSGSGGYELGARLRQEEKKKLDFKVLLRLCSYTLSGTGMGCISTMLRVAYALSGTGIR